MYEILYIALLILNLTYLSHFFSLRRGHLHHEKIYTETNEGLANPISKSSPSIGF